MLYKLIMQKNIVNQLNDFIDLANKNRRYPDNTASGLKAAISRFNDVLNEDERVSLELIDERFEQIMLDFFNKHKNDMTDGSLRTYQARINRVLRDFKKWGSNPQNWSSWSVSGTRARKKSNKSNNNETENAVTKQENSSSNTFEPGKHDVHPSTKFEIPLRDGISAFISTPMDINKDEVDKIKKYVDYLSSIAEDV